MITEHRRVTVVTASQGLATMARKEDADLATEKYHDGSKRCAYCNCKLSIRNPEPVCWACDQKHGPFQSVLTKRETFNRQCGIGAWGEGARKRERERGLT